MRVYVYAIARDEAAFARRWMESMSEADGVYVLDTGSGDGTAERLRSLGCCVTERRVEPWRFDRARNESMALVPGDGEVLVCTDLDELFRPGWRKALEAAWRPEMTVGRYEYVWSFGPDGSDGVKFYAEKIHRAGRGRWTHPVHEVLDYGEPPVSGLLPGVRLEHHPDGNKSRESYLSLLEMSVAEAPEDDRNMHYLGREYMFHGRWEEAEATLRRHLALPTARWDAERAASIRYIARCMRARGRVDEEELWLLRAAMEAPGYREAWTELGKLMFRQERWEECVRYLSRALDIKERPMSYISEPECWGALPWDLISIAWWKLGQRLYAANCARQALALAPGETRIRDNLRLFEGTAGKER